MHVLYDDSQGSTILICLSLSLRLSLSSLFFHAVKGACVGHPTETSKANDPQPACRLSLLSLSLSLSFLRPASLCFALGRGGQAVPTPRSWEQPYPVILTERARLSRHLLRSLSLSFFLPGLGVVSRPSGTWPARPPFCLLCGRLWGIPDYGTKQLSGIRFSELSPPP